jgi:hypothetical protein
LQLATPFNGTYFGHVMFKTCHYAINDIQIGVGMKEMSLIEAQSSLQKTITIYIDKKSRGWISKNGDWCVKKLA